MASNYSTNLKLELITTGEQAGTWGTTTNTNLGTALEESIVGYGNPDFTSDADLTLTLSDSNSTQTARNLVLNVTSVTLSATRNLVVPTIEKPYVVQNNTTGGQSIVVKTSGGSGVTIPNGKSAIVYADGTNVVSQVDHIPSLTLGAALPVASGGTGATTHTANNVLLGNGTSAFQEVAPGTVGNVLVSDGTTWTSGVGVPSGSLFMWPTASPPTGYLSCNGTAVSRTTYSALFAVLGTTFGSGDGSTTFNLPDYRDRMPIGAGTTYSAADTGGSKDAIVVSHSHGLSAATTSTTTSLTGTLYAGKPNGASGIVSGVFGQGGGGDGNQATGAAYTINANHNHTLSGNTDSAGTSGTDANLPPYIGIYFIIKT